MKDCPIGLICEDFDCDAFGRSSYCQRLAAAWPLPYRIVPASIWFPMAHSSHLLVKIPEFSDVPVDSLDIIKTEVWAAGFFDSIKLPYQAHPEGGLLVVEWLSLTAEITFICPLVYRFHEHLNCWLNDSPDIWEGDKFMPALPLPEDEYEYSRGSGQFWNPVLPDIEPGEFWEDCYLYYPSRPDEDITNTEEL
ncbi:hypothetical protein [Nostoc sp.]|uniref:hypothetical protein n=1 Tax=Nostoc sp. TaxID=1180 RepID=UPI002FF778D7